MTESCPVCGGHRDAVFSKRLLGRYDVSYLYCADCGLLQTEEPYWLEEAYSDAIADADTGLLARNTRLSRKCASLFYFLFPKAGQFVDNAGGYGVLTRLMRDYGFDCYWHDKYCQNMFARGFEASSEQSNCAAVTAFEVLEHIQDPVEFIRTQLAQYGSDTLFLSTELYKDKPPEDWWYYATDTGQHISFYQARTLSRIAEQLSLNLYSCGNFHIFSSRSLSPFLVKVLAGHGSFPAAMWVKLRMPSLTFSDHLRVCELSDSGVSKSGESA